VEPLIKQRNKTKNVQSTICSHFHKLANFVDLLLNDVENIIYDNEIHLMICDATSNITNDSIRCIDQELRDMNYY
jgi:hypothetical protein